MDEKASSQSLTAKACPGGCGGVILDFYFFVSYLGFSSSKGGKEREQDLGYSL